MKINKFVVCLILNISNLFAQDFLGTIEILKNQRLVLQTDSKYYILKHQINYPTLINPENDILVPVKICIEKKTWCCYLPINIFSRDANNFKSPFCDIKIILENNDIYILKMDISIFNLDISYKDFLKNHYNCCTIQ